MGEAVFPTGETDSLSVHMEPLMGQIAPPGAISGEEMVQGKRHKAFSSCTGPALNGAHACWGLSSQHRIYDTCLNGQTHSLCAVRPIWNYFMLL